MESITLIDGTVLPVTLKVGQPDHIRPDMIALDTSGEYLSIGRRPHTRQADMPQRALQKYYYRLFVENAWTLFNNANRIMGDSRMFLTPVHIDNHLAYTGTGGFAHPTAGVYVEWWLTNKDCAIDRNGNLVWYIAGSPLSGANACMAVDRDNRSVRMSQGDVRFSSIWESFMKVNQRYTEAGQRCEAYSLEDLLAVLRGESYHIYMDALRQEMIDRTRLYDDESMLDGFKRKTTQIYRNALLKTKQASVLDFYGHFTAKENEIESAMQRGDTTDARRMLHDLAEYAAQFVTDTFGSNPSQVCLTDIIRFAKQKYKS